MQLIFIIPKSAKLIKCNHEISPSMILSVNQALCDAHNPNNKRNQRNLDDCFSEKTLSEIKTKCTQNQTFDCIIHHQYDTQKMAENLERLANSKAFDNQALGFQFNLTHILRNCLD